MMYKKKKLIAYILATLACAVTVSPAYTNITKTQAQTPAVQRECTDSQIKRYIQQIENNDYTILDRVSACQSKSIPVLIKALSSQDEVMHMSAIASFGKLGSDAAPALPALTKLLDDENEDVRIVAVDTFGKIGKEAVPALVKALNDKEDWTVRYIATKALGRIGTDAKQAIPTLIATLNDEDLHVRTEAADTLAKIGKDAVPALITALANKNWFVRYSAADILRQIGGDAKDALPALSLVIKDENYQVRNSANYALFAIRLALKNPVESQTAASENESEDELVPYEAIRESTDCSFQGISTQSCSNGQVTPTTVRIATSRVMNNPPLICRVSALRAIFRWKCP